MQHKMSRNHEHMIRHDFILNARTRARDLGRIRSASAQNWAVLVQNELKISDFSCVEFVRDVEKLRNDLQISKMNGNSRTVTGP